MAWIETIPANEAQDELKELYTQLAQKRGKISNIMQVQGLNPPAMKAHLDLYVALMFRPSGLKREQREMIAVTVSQLNECAYCVNHHAEALRFYWKDEQKLKQFLEDYRCCAISGAEKKMLDYVVQLTRDPGGVRRKHVELLQAAEFSDRDILDINLITGYFNLVNRIANGLGVEFNPDEVTGYHY